MDELDNLSNPSDTPEILPYPDFSPEPPSSNFGLKLVVLLVVVGLIAGFIYLGGARPLLDWYASQPALFQNTTKIQELKSDTAFSALALPSNVRLIGVYHAPFKNKGLNVFLAAPEKDPLVLPKDFSLSLQLGAHKGAVYYLVAVKDSASSIDQNLKTIGDIVRQQGAASHVQSKIWISEKEVPASIDEIVKGDQVFQLLSLRISEAAGLLAITPVAGIEQAPYREMIAALVHVQTTAVSLTPPEPAGLKWARAVLSSDVGERKKAVPMLATLGGPQPEAVAFLADAFASAPSDVKIDIIAALGLLAPATPQAAQPLIVALKDKPVRLEAMAALGSLGPSAKEAVPALRKIALNKKEPKPVRASANTAIAKITGKPLAAPPAKSKKKKKHRR